MAKAMNDLRLSKIKIQDISLKECFRENYVEIFVIDVFVCDVNNEHVENIRYKGDNCIQDFYNYFGFDFDNFYEYNFDLYDFDQYIVEFFVLGLKGVS